MKEVYEPAMELHDNASPNRAALPSRSIRALGFVPRFSCQDPSAGASACLSCPIHPTPPQSVLGPVKSLARCGERDALLTVSRLLGCCWPRVGTALHRRICLCCWLKVYLMRKYFIPLMARAFIESWSRPCAREISAADASGAVPYQLQ